MILTCPQCSTRYQTDEAKFPPAGRTVRCAKCGHSWHQAAPMAQPDPEPEPELSLPEEPPLPAQPGSVRDYAPRAQVAPDRFERPRRQIGQTVAILAGWLGLIAVVLGIGFAAVKYRQDIASVWPQSAGLYSGLGLAVNANGIDFRDVSYRRQSEDGQAVLAVTGTIINVGSRELPVPQSVRVTLSDENRHELYHWTFKPDALTLKPGQSVPFRTRLASPPAAARNLEVRFAAE